MSVFSFVDRIVEVKKNESLTAHFTLRGDEEFLEDHFSGFPVMPGVLLLEAVKQAAAAFLEMTGRSAAPTDVPRSKDCGLESSFGVPGRQYRLASAQDVRFGQFVKPGSLLEISVRFMKAEKDSYFFDGRIRLLTDQTPSRKALTAGFCLKPVL